ncbi:MAG: HAMP domain-containing protein [Ignavibacteria bacterium]|nr:HAMP domain-containing protein [Ignavibacteria bacterium]
MILNKPKSKILTRIKKILSFKSVFLKSAMFSWSLIILTVIIFIVVFIPLQKDSEIRKMQSEVQDIATSIAQVTATAIISEDYSFAVEHCMSVLKGSNSILSIVITKNDGFSLVHNKDNWTLENLDSSWYKLNEKKILGSIKQSKFSDSEVFQYSYPLKYSGINWGWIHIENSLDEYNEYYANVYLRLIGLSLVLILLGFVFSFYFANRLVKPIRAVDSVAQSIANGDLSVRIDMKTSTEIQSLAESFNKMAINLKKAQENLESKVAERTKQLLDSNTELEKYKVELEKLVDTRTQTIKEVNSALIDEIEKLQKAEREIDIQYKFLKTLQETIPIPIYILDEKANFTDCNPAFETHFRKRNSDLIGHSFYSLFTEEDQSEFRQHKNQLFKEGFSTFEIQLNHSSNSKKDLIFFESIFKSAIGETTGIVGVILDITDIKESQRKTLSALNKEKELTELRTKFFSHASHEFRTPLATILSSVELISIMNPDISSKDNGVHLEQVFNSVDYMTNLLDDILTINKADTGKFLLNPESMNLFEFITSLTDEMHSNEKFKHEINITCDSKDRTIIGDKKLLRLIFANLLSNAIKYSPDSSNIDINIDQSDSHIAIKVIDQGIGISEDEQKNLFEPFFRASNAGDVKGTGLGLSLIKKVVEQHRGIIKFKSVPNKGSEFIVTLPLTNENILNNKAS